MYTLFQRESEIMSQCPDQASIYTCTKNIPCKYHWMLSLMIGCLLLSVMSVQCINLSKLIFVSLINSIAIFHSFKFPVKWNIIFTYQCSVMCSQWLLIGDNYKKINLHSAVAGVITISLFCSWGLPVCSRQQGTGTRVRSEETHSQRGHPSF